MNYATIGKAKEWGVSQRRVDIYCKADRIERETFWEDMAYSQRGKETNRSTQIRKDDWRKND